VAKLTVWSELDAARRLELNIPGSRASRGLLSKPFVVAEKFTGKLAEKDTEAK